MITKTVADVFVMPMKSVRPREPGQHQGDAHLISAGLAPSFTNAVAKHRLMPRAEVRPREPGHRADDVQDTHAGLAPFQNRRPQDVGNRNR
jgi:hypothetical protein